MKLEQVPGRETKSAKGLWIRRGHAVVSKLDITLVKLYPPAAGSADL
jgi:hypothetical protein